MGQAESVEADESQITEHDQDRFSFYPEPESDGPRLVSRNGRTSVDRTRRPPGQSKRYSSTSTESESVLHFGQPSLHRSDAFRYPHPLYTESPTDSIKQYKNSARKNKIFFPHLGLAANGNKKSKSSPVVCSQSLDLDLAISNADEPFLKDNVSLEQSLDNGSEPEDFKHSNDPTSRHSVDTASTSSKIDTDGLNRTEQLLNNNVGKITKEKSDNSDNNSAIVTEYSDTEESTYSEIIFNPEELETNTSTPKSKRRDDTQDSSGSAGDTLDNMDSAYRHASAASAGEYSASGARASRSASRSSAAQRGSSAHSAAAAAAASSSKSSKKMSASSSKSSKRRSKSGSRARSDSSFSEASAASKSSLGSTAKKVKEENKKRIKDRLTKTEHKGSITDRWQGVINEFQDTKSTKKEEKRKNERKVSKLKNLDKFDNVKQIFGKGLPLPMQHGPPGSRLRDIEGETASEESTHSWTALKPLRKSTSEYKHTRSYQQGVDAANRRGQSITGDRRMTENMTRQARMSSDAYNIKASGSAANSSSSITMGQNNRKGVKFHKKKIYEIEDEAVIIVDDAIRRALGLVTGRKSMSRSAATKRKQQNLASRKSSASSSASASKQADHTKISRTNNIIRDYKTENIYRESIVKDLRGQKNRAMSNVGAIRKRSIRPVPRAGRRSEGNAPAQMPPPRPPLNAGGFYELDITPYQGKDKENEVQEKQQVQRRYSEEGTPSRFHVGSSSTKSFTIPPFQQPASSSGQSIQTCQSQNSSFQVNEEVNYNIYNHGQAYQSQQDLLNTVESNTNEPTISKGNVTRVLHQVNDQNAGTLAPGQILQHYRSMDEINGEYSTNTWPLTKNPTQANNQYDSSFTSNVSESVKLDTTTNYASLPGAMGMQQDLGMRQTSTLPANRDMYQSGQSAMYSSHTLNPQNTFSIGIDRRGTVNSLEYQQPVYLDPLERPASTPAILETNMYSPPPIMSGNYGAYTIPHNVTTRTGPQWQHQRFYQSHYGSTGNLTQPMPTQPVNMQFNLQPTHYTDMKTQSSVSPPVRTTSNKSAHYGSDIVDYSAYSNEPIIVADLMDKTQPPPLQYNFNDQVELNRIHSPRQTSPPPTSKFYSNRGDNPSVTMGRQQTLNFFVFGNKSQSETDVRQASYDIGPRNIKDDFNMSGFYYDRERQRQDYIDFYDTTSDQYETRSEPDYHMREMVIHHKQTQTLPPPKKKKPPVVKRIEKREMQTHKHFPPKRYIPPVHHKETTHYITKERQIEKLPPQPPKKFSHSVQTDLSGSVVNRQKARPKVQKYSSATQYEKPPSPPRKRDTRVEVTNRVFAPRVTETRDFFKETITSAEPEVQTSGTEVPISLKQSPEENVIDIIESYNQPSGVELGLVESQSRAVAQPDDSDESEMEIIETIEIEEKEQKLSMAIFEEIEFHFERSKDGQTETQSGKASDLLPFQFPGKYETTVERRKQKCTQLKEVTSGGSHHYEYDGNVNRHLPAPNYQSAIEMKNEGNQNGYYDGEVETIINQTQNMNLQNSNHNNRSHHERLQKRVLSADVDNRGQHFDVAAVSSDNRSGAHNRQVRVVSERSQTNIPSNSSGYSSSDTTSSTAIHRSDHSISAGGPFRIPVNESDEEESEEIRVYRSELKDINLTPQELSPHEYEENEVSNSSKFISRFDPENVYFTVPEWTESKQMYGFTSDGTKILRTTDGQDNDSLPESLPAISISPDIPDGQYKRVRKGREDTPKLRTRVVKDEAGNLMKITEVEKTVTKTEEFTENEDERKMSANSEQLRGSEYMEMNLNEITEGQNLREHSSYLQEHTQEVEDEEGESSGGEAEYILVGPEVVGETTVTQVPVEYDEQVKSLNLNDDLTTNVEEQKYLYDMKTATLSPVMTKDSRSGAVLMQYGYNDMITEL